MFHLVLTCPCLSCRSSQFPAPAIRHFFCISFMSLVSWYLRIRTMTSVRVRTNVDKFCGNPGSIRAYWVHFGVSNESRRTSEQTGWLTGWLGLPDGLHSGLTGLIVGVARMHPDEPNFYTQGNIDIHFVGPFVSSCTYVRITPLLFCVLENRIWIAS